jgi:Ser/Thr protein kinase RdoA (MazF antagonist)
VVDSNEVGCSNGAMDAGNLARRFGLDGPARLSDGPVARGRQGLVWRLETSEGSWAVKVPFRPCTEEEVRSATALQEAAHAAGVPTPQVRRTREGAVFAALGGRRARLYGWVDLCAPDARLDPAQVGAVVGAIHAIAPADPGELEPWYRDPVGAQGWDHLVEQLVRAGAPFARRLADLRDELVALESWLEPPRGLRTCHRDLWADNVLPTPEGGVCVLDWENSGPADQGQELACVLFEFGRTDAGRARELTSAYRAAGGTASVSRRGDFSMLIAELGHITELAAKDWLQPNERSPDRADSTAWIAEVLDEPHTRDFLDALLATV